MTDDSEEETSVPITVMGHDDGGLTVGEECDEKPLWKQTLCAQLHWSCRRIRSELSVRLKVLFTST